MALVRRQVSQLLRWCAWALLASTLVVVRVHAQSETAAQTADELKRAIDGIKPLPSSTEAPAAPQIRVLDIRIVGNRSVTREKVLANISTRIDRPFDEAIFAKDVRTLSKKGWFVEVRQQRENVPGGVIITLEVVERPRLEYVKYLGNKKIKAHTLSKETSLKKGDPMDPYAVEEGRRKLESLYQTKGHGDVKVTVLEGTKPGDKGAVYLINEGQKQKIWQVNFEGNTIVNDGRLKTVIQSKPPLLYMFKGLVDRKKIDEDVQKLVDYYRGLGYFKATVSRDYEYNENENWMTLNFFINEGPRYQVRNISFIGNKVYDEAALASDLKLKPGADFDQGKMNADIGLFKDIYGSTGYAFATAEAELKFFEEPGQLDLIYQIHEGKQYKVGEVIVHIKGDNPHTKYSTVLNQLTIRPGDVVDVRKIRKSETTLKRQGIFNADPSKGEAPKISLLPPDSEDGQGIATGGGSGGGGKGRGSARRTGNPDSFRGQSPDEPRPLPVLPPAAVRQGSPNVPPPADGSTIRGQSPDGYGGSSVYQVSPGPQRYTANQAPTNTAQQPPVYQPPAGQPYAQPGYGQPSYPPQNSPPPAYGSQGGVAPQGATPGNNGGGLFPPPGNFLSPEPIDTPTVPLVVDVGEAQTGKFMFGAGVNSNAGLVGNIVIDEQNFDWRRVPTSWEDFRSGQAFRGAGQKFRIEAAPGTQVSRYMVNFAEPYFLDTPVSMGLNAFYYNRFFRNWTEQRVGGRASLGYQFTPDLSGNFALRAEDIRISNPTPTYVPDPLDPTKFILFPVPALQAVLGHSQLYSGTWSLAHDTRDNLFLPTEGHYIQGGFEYAFINYPQAGFKQFPRFTLNARKHFLLRERPDGSGRHTLSLYNQFGVTGNNTPIYERFYAGGFSSLRGFQFRGADPASPTIPPVYVGGDFQNLSSVEYMFPITADDMLRGVTFVDFGAVETSISHIDTRSFRVAPGFGIRVTIAAISAAPIALDFAFPVAYAPNDLRQVFSFFVGFGH